MSDNKTMRDYFMKMGSYGVLIAVFSIGFAIGSNKWSSSAALLNSLLTVEKEEKVQVQKELEQVKEEYSQYRNNHQNDNDSNNDLIIKSQFSNDTTKLFIPTEYNYISTGKSISFFDEDLIISLRATPFGGDPLRHRVFANINSITGESKKSDYLDIGDDLIYKNSKNTYKITILEASTFSAKFQVSRIE